MTTCPTCGQTLPEEMPFDMDADYLGPVQKVILRAVHRAGSNGILSTDLFDVIYASTINGGPASGVKALHAHIHYINKKLKPQGLMIRGCLVSRRQPSKYVLLRI